jgi:hypothetical protein
MIEKDLVLFDCIRVSLKSYKFHDSYVRAHPPLATTQ